MDIRYQKAMPSATITIGQFSGTAKSVKCGPATQWYIRLAYKPKGSRYSSLVIFGLGGTIRKASDNAIRQARAKLARQETILDELDDAMINPDTETSVVHP